MHCGWLEPSSWIPWTREVVHAMPHGYAGAEIDKRVADVCPTWLVQQPAVLEAANAADALTSGCFELEFPNLENSAYEAGRLGQRVFKNFEACALRDAAQGENVRGG